LESLQNPYWHYHCYSCLVPDRAREPNRLTLGQGDFMSLKDLLVIADNDPPPGARLDIVLALAAEHHAHLTGLHVMPPLTPIYGDMPVPETVEKMQRLQLEDPAGRAAAVLAERAGGATVSTEWRVAEGDIVRVASEHARYADLTVLPQGMD